MSANEKGIIAVTGRAHCQRQVAFFSFVAEIGTIFLFADSCQKLFVAGCQNESILSTLEEVRGPWWSE